MRVLRQGPAQVLRVIGDLDEEGARELSRTVEELLPARPAGVEAVVIDLADVAVVAAAGARALVELRAARAERVELRLVVPERLRGTSVASDLADHFVFFETAAQALVVDATPERVDDLERQLAQRTEQLATQPVIEQAKGMLMQDFGLADEEAFAVLVSLSQDGNTKLRQVAGDVVELLRGSASQHTARGSYASIAELREHLLGRH